MGTGTPHARRGWPLAWGKGQTFPIGLQLVLNVNSRGISTSYHPHAQGSTPPLSPSCFEQEDIDLNPAGGGLGRVLLLGEACRWVTVLPFLAVLKPRPSGLKARDCLVFASYSAAKSSCNGPLLTPSRDCRVWVLALNVRLVRGCDRQANEGVEVYFVDSHANSSP